MTKNRTIIILGIIIAITPLLGFPSSFKNFIFISFGLIISLTAYLILREQKHDRAYIDKETFSDKGSLNKEVHQKDQAQNSFPTESQSETQNRFPHESA
jgi:flagellar biosynthesis component FlhA